MNYVFVFIGGGLGSLTRFVFSTYFGTLQNGFPFATFLSNTISCLVLGIVVSTLLTRNISSQSTAYVLLFFATGFCGGFSTFSTFSLETFQLMNNAQYGIALGNVLANVLLCYVAVATGFYLGKVL